MRQVPPCAKAIALAIDLLAEKHHYTILKIMLSHSVAPPQDGATLATVAAWNIGLGGRAWLQHRFSPSGRAAVFPHHPPHPPACVAGSLMTQLCMDACE